MNNFTGSAVTIYQTRAIARSKCTDRDKLVDLKSKAAQELFGKYKLQPLQDAVENGKRWAVVDLYGPAEGVQKACGGIIKTSAKGLKGQTVPVMIRKAVH